MDSRTKNTKRNIISGLIKQVLDIVLPFIIRTLILYILGELYQGLNGLFSSILQVLNLADLGFTSAVVYILYKPIADENWDEVKAIIAFLRKVYKIVGTIVLVIGLAIMPLLPYLISGEYPSDINIYVLFSIYLLNSVISYFFFAYKSALLTAMQRTDVVTNITSITSTATRVIQIVLLIVFKNYYIYIVLAPIGTIINNFLYQIASKKLFPNLVPSGKMQPETRSLLNKQIKGIFINNVSDVARNSFDNIILSSLLGLAMVAIYNNYYYIYSALYGITIVITNAMKASVGNSIATETVEKNYLDLRKFTFVFSWFTGWCTVCMFCLYQPFMNIWMRGNASLILDNFNMTLFCIYFYAITMNNTRNLYLEGYGLFWECRIWYLVEAIANLLLNFILGYFFGITGILLATIITIFFFNFIARNRILFKSYFRCSKKYFYLDHLLYIIVMLVAAAITYAICFVIPLNGWLGLFVKACICIVVPNLILLLIYFKNPLFKLSLSFVKNVLKIKK
jgi:O-antigen/teichoic acid export membrane protein